MSATLVEPLLLSIFLVLALTGVSAEAGFPKALSWPNHEPLLLEERERRSSLRNSCLVFDLIFELFSSSEIPRDNPSDAYFLTLHVLSPNHFKMPTKPKLFQCDREQLVNVLKPTQMKHTQKLCFFILLRALKQRGRERQIPGYVSNPVHTYPGIFESAYFLLRI